MAPSSSSSPSSWPLSLCTHSNLNPFYIPLRWGHQVVVAALDCVRRSCQAVTSTNKSRGDGAWPLVTLLWHLRPEVVLSLSWLAVHWQKRPFPVTCGIHYTGHWLSSEQLGGHRFKQALLLMSNPADGPYHRNLGKKVWCRLMGFFHTTVVDSGVSDSGRFWVSQLATRWRLSWARWYCQTNKCRGLCASLCQLLYPFSLGKHLVLRLLKASACTFNSPYLQISVVCS